MTQYRLSFIQLLPGVLFLVSLLVPVSALASSDARESIVKIYTVHNYPDYYNPWSMRGPRQSTGSGCVIDGKRILTNGHVVGNQTYIQVRRYGESKRYTAKVLRVSHDADLALLVVEDESFFDGIPALKFGELSEPQDKVSVYGFPLGGDTLSITEGIVSRVEHQNYAHSSCYFLAGQIDAAINPGNSGGPVIMNDQIVGGVMQSIRQADNIGYMVPIPIIQHFMTDIEDGQYDGFPSLGVVLQEMENPDLKAKYNLPENRTGMLITRVLVNSPAENLLEVGDVLLELDGHAVADDGTVEFRPQHRTAVSYFVQEHQVGESMVVTVLRDGEDKKVDITLKRSLREDWLIPQEEYDVLPRYYVYGGVVFCPLTKNLLQAWGGNWYNVAPKNFVAMLSANYAEHPDEEKVLVLKVLADDVNIGYHSIAYWLVEKVNGEKIKNLKELVRIVEDESNDSYVVLKNKYGQQIVLDRKKVMERQQSILDLYRIRQDRSEDFKSP